jgi:peptidoglycan hydrolase-like protein with peptidoglycan-binding domain
LDGDFGSNTDYALKNYQTSEGLDADGIAGSKTWASIIGL